MMYNETMEMAMEFVELMAQAFKVMDTLTDEALAELAGETLEKEKVITEEYPIVTLKKDKSYAQRRKNDAHKATAKLNKSTAKHDNAVYEKETKERNGKKITYDIVKYVDVDGNATTLTIGKFRKGNPCNPKHSKISKSGENNHSDLKKLSKANERIKNAPEDILNELLNELLETI